MPTTIEVNKQSVEALLGSGKTKPFVIPEYQRPYAWTDEQVETLFEDLWDFTATSGGTEREGSYFWAVLWLMRMKTVSKKLSTDSSVLHLCFFAQSNLHEAGCNPCVRENSGSK